MLAAYPLGMIAIEPASAVIIRIAVPRALATLRGRTDSAAGAGVPPHVTILYPFLPAAQLGPDVRRELASIAADEQPFEVRFTRVGRFPTAVFVAPEPSSPFLRLTEAVAARFPDYPPYGGAFDEVIPHLTICESHEAALDEIAALADRSLPFTRPVAALEVLVESDDDRWRTHWRLPLGVRS